jgi:hypothetical protein
MVATDLQVCYKLFATDLEVCRHVRFRVFFTCTQIGASILIAIAELEIPQPH